MQAPIARRFAPNVCSALAPPGASSQARNGLFQIPELHVLALTKGHVGSGNEIAPKRSQYSTRAENMAVTAKWVMGLR